MYPLERDVKYGISVCSCDEPLDIFFENIYESSAFRSHSNTALAGGGDDDLTRCRMVIHKLRIL